MKIFLNGAQGRMGKAISAIADQEKAVVQIAATREQPQLEDINTCDVVLDFSTHEATLAIAAAAAKAGKPLIIGTTGHTPEEKAAILEYQRKIPIVWAGNYAVGVNLLFYLTEKVAATLTSDFHPEVVEMHHRMKKDAPSGTAENLVEAILRGRNWAADKVRHGRSGITGERPDEEIGVHSLRGGEVVGEHTVIFAGPGERLELKHQASDRRIFAQGAIVASRWALDQAPGLYNMQDVLGLK
jgi:4-hydroxy-tetrahydrodipicolinate reductase